MSCLPSMRHRHPGPELMDLPDCDETLLLRTVRQFKLLNRLFSAQRRLLKRHVLKAMRRDTGRTWTVLDIGAGGGDLDAWLAMKARRMGMRIEITALDLDERLLPLLRETVAPWPEVKVVQGDAQHIRSLGGFDFVVCNHFLHHFANADAMFLVMEANAIARVGILLNDLRRSRLAYLGYSLFTALFVRRSFAFADGRLSIRRGFTFGEMEVMAGPEMRARRAFPARLYLTRRT